MIVLCPGQGAQALGMGQAWFNASAEARAVFEEADRILGSRLGAPLSQLCFTGPVERLNQTDVAQPALFTCGIACWRGLTASMGLATGEAPIAAAAGLSLGEYTALCVAGALSFADGLELVTLRGRAMQDAAVASPGGMLALIGADEAQANEVCAGALEGHPSDVLVPANFNAPGQIVLSGHKVACDRAAEVAGKLGLRATALQVAGAFHSPLMAPAAERLRAALASVKISEPRCPVVSNVTERPHPPFRSVSGGTFDADIRRKLEEQLTSPVRWAGSCAYMAETFKGVWHELAPGKTLAGLMRRIHKDTKVTAHDEP
jgi:[acyl-carrier-protein] S-malonyltransferase